MTILNHPTDGLYPELIALARVVAHERSIEEDDLVSICSHGERARISGALSRWSRLGLFARDDGRVQIGKAFLPRRGQSLDEWTDVLPSICRKLALSSEGCLPLWGESEGVCADFAKGLAWLLAQDIYNFPRVWKEGAEKIEEKQLRSEPIIQNDTRWSGLRFWARYLGFATGDSRTFFVDPTTAIREVLPELKEHGNELDARTFVAELAKRLPVLDTGIYRVEIENRLDKSSWPRPPAKHLSMSISFALRRLDLDQILSLESKADTEDGYSLAGRDYRTVRNFTHVRLRKAKK